MGGRKNILLLSTGRRVSLARAFKAAAARAGSELLTADMNPERSAACRDNGRFICLPHVREARYADELALACQTHNVGLVVPTIDTELTVLAGLRGAFLNNGTVLAVSNEDLVAAARDKRITPSYFARFGIQSPEVYADGELLYPAFAKPFDGSLSRGTFALKSPDDLTPAVLNTPNIMFMRYLDPEEHDEFTCDAYYDRAGALRCVVPRQRLEVRGGEISKGVTCRNELVQMFFEKLAHLPGARGCLTFQFFLHRSSRAAWLIELNPRFGGGFPISLAAGANYPEWLIAEYLQDKHVDIYDDWAGGLLALRYDSEIIVRGSAQ